MGIWFHCWGGGERGAHVRRRKGGLASFFFYVMIAQLKSRTHSTTLGHSFSSFAARCQFRFFYYLFFPFFSWTFDRSAVTPTYVPVTDSFAFYSTRVQYAPCACAYHNSIPALSRIYRTYTHIIDAHYIHQPFLSRYNVTNHLPI